MTAPLPHRVRFMRLSPSDDGHHGVNVIEGLYHECDAALQFRSGSEADDAGRLTARGFVKVKLRSCAAARGLLASDVMLDRADRRYNLRAVDAVTDPYWVWIDAEFGVRDEAGSAA